MQQFFSLLSWRLFTAQHVSGVFPPIIRSSMTAVATSGFTFVLWWQSCCVRGRAGRQDILKMHGPINVKSPNNISKWQMGFNSAFKGLKSSGPKTRNDTQDHVITLNCVVCCKTTIFVRSGYQINYDILRYETVLCSFVNRALFGRSPVVSVL
jgi:hypothetical protein